MKGKIFILALLIMLAVPTLISAYKVNSDVVIDRTCNNCTYCNLTSLQDPNQATLLANKSFSQSGTYFNYLISYVNNSKIGDYKWCWVCGNEQDSVTGCNSYVITSSGDSANSTLIVVLVLFGLAYILLFLGASYDRFHILQMLGGFFLILLSVYILQNGIGFFDRGDLVVVGFGIVSVGVGAYHLIKDLIETDFSNKQDEEE